MLACAHSNRLMPAPGAGVAGDPRVAEHTAQGVHLRVDSGAWRAGSVRDALVPVQVRIENGSGRALRVTHSQFTLNGGAGFRIQALQPLQVAVQNASSAIVPGYEYSGFWLAQWQARFYHPGYPIWSGAMGFDSAYYAAWHGAWPASLPDLDVLQRALPEGIADPGGTVSGFLYFPDQPRGKALLFTASLIDAGTNESFGSINIPFIVK